MGCEDCDHAWSASMGTSCFDLCNRIPNKAPSYYKPIKVVIEADGKVSCWDPDGNLLLYEKMDQLIDNRESGEWAQK